jgi:hypothetical protein
MPLERIEAHDLLSANILALANWGSGLSGV